MQKQAFPPPPPLKDVNAPKNEAAEKGEATPAAAAPPAPTEGGGEKESRAAPYVWDPLSKKGKGCPSRECLKRTKKDLRDLLRSPLPGVFVAPDEENVTVVHALITGPFDTPYAGGFFYFILRCPDSYPYSPPKVKLMTTGGGRVRFNPNLYQNGKVCLSILGTWHGPGWTPVHSLSSVLLSIQSLMNDKPYHNEPGFEVAWNPDDVSNYSACITHETLRVAVCEMVGPSTSMHKSLPLPFQQLTKDLFVSFVDHYTLICQQNCQRDGAKFADPFNNNLGSFQYAKVLRQIREIEQGILVGDDTTVAVGDSAAVVGDTAAAVVDETTPPVDDSAAVVGDTAAAVADERTAAATAPSTGGAGAGEATESVQKAK